mgnify:CR=1 FL=1
MKIKKKQKQKAHIIKNTAFMLKCALKCAPFSLFIIYFSYVLENVYYAVVINVMFLETALSIIEGNGTFQEFVIRIGVIILGKIFSTSPAKNSILLILFIFINCPHL